MIVEASIPQQQRATRLTVIDLSVPRTMAPYDKSGCRRLIVNVKSELFGAKGRVMKRAAAEEFFDNEGNFDLP